MEYTDEDARKILESMENLQVKMCDEDWYVHYILEQIWDDIPEEYRRPSNIPEIRRLIVKRIDETREGFMRNAGLLEDEDDEEEIIEYIININITDEVSGTVHCVQGGGPSYRDIVRELEEAAGSVCFYEFRDKKRNGDANVFSIVIKIYRNDEIIDKQGDANILREDVIQILRDARYDMGRIYNKDTKEKGN